MGILKLTKPVQSEFECETLGYDNVGEDAHLVRPCERYRELYKSCKSLRGRLHQYYVYGELFDCSEHNENYTNCMKFRKTKEPSTLEPVINWEKKLMDSRMKATLANPTWQMRDTPPKDFNEELPQFIQDRQSWKTFPRL